MKPRLSLAALAGCATVHLTGAHVMQPPETLTTKIQEAGDVDNAGIQAAAPVSQCKLPAVQRVHLSEGHGFTGASCAASTGTLRAFMFFVDFSDQPATSSETPSGLASVMLPEAPAWFNTSSYGRLALDVKTDTTKYYRMPAAASSYNWDRGLTYDAHAKYIQDALKAYGKTIATVDVLYVVAAKAATKISFSPTTIVPIKDAAGNTVARNGAVTIGYDTYTAWKYKVINHETGHILCLPDLYPDDGGGNGKYVGGFDLMGYINGISPDYFGWHKWKLGWLDDSQVACVAEKGTTTHTLSPIEVKGTDTKIIVVRQNETAALVAEVRSRNAVDAAAGATATCGTGVVLYNVYTNVRSAGGPIRVLDANPGSSCGGEALNDGMLTMEKTKTYKVPGWGVTVTVLGKTGESYTVQVDMA